MLSMAKPTTGPATRNPSQSKVVKNAVAATLAGPGTRDDQAQEHWKCIAMSGTTAALPP
jgi:hypothetical protein